MLGPRRTPNLVETPTVAGGSVFSKILRIQIITDKNFLVLEGGGGGGLEGSLLGAVVSEAYLNIHRLSLLHSCRGGVQLLLPQTQAYFTVPTKITGTWGTTVTLSPLSLLLCDCILIRPYLPYRGLK